jgi:transcriptional regulator with XRE-family HTH domain
MAISAKDRFARLPKARREKILVRAEEMIAEEMTLAELREARARSQAQLAAKLGIQQAAVSRLERRTDMYLSTLRDLIASMGGTLRIIAQFPDRPPVSISQFHDAFAIEPERAEYSPPSSGSTDLDRAGRKKHPKRGAGWHRRKTT